MSKTVGVEGMKLIKKWEGCKLTAYKDSVGVWTIGWGTTKYPNGIRVKQGDKITQVEADAMLKRQVQEHADGMLQYISVSKLNQNQYDALASFHYNLGRHILKGSTLATYLNAGDWNKATNSMLQYNKGRINGVLTVLKGLQNRRNAEVELFKKTPQGTITQVSANTSKLAVDGYWGTATTKRLQKVLGVTVDGVLGKNTIRAIQKKVSADPDGILGKATIKAMQKRFKTPVDGIISKPSSMVKAMQRKLNNNKF